MMVICQGLVTKSCMGTRLHSNHNAAVMHSGLAGLCITISMFQSDSEGISYLPMFFYGLSMVYGMVSMVYLLFMVYGICMVYGLPGLSGVPSVSGETT